MSRYEPEVKQQKPMPVVILNGPPNSGKDAIAKALANWCNVVHLEMKECMFSIALATSGVTEKDWYQRYNNRELKEEPWSILGGLSQRQFMIKISEEWMKPLFGKDVFGVRAAESARQKIWTTQGKYAVVFTDGGFKEELDAMVRTLGEDNVLLVRVHRDGTNFDNDSRNYLPDIKHTHDLHNDDTLEHASFDLAQAILKCRKS
jgi:hypothetical protein